ncbi:class 1 fructose-bisphosphatase [Salinilacihabitans rarus]|uniref:class 1 fructose-bisphosphatase n=1 Tax=Salinilacihabitans rarus TaxID=2961596 RepID=UPI0020C85D0A|nr:class 1 fructose-bisphosphatase [Salinilacihabitans rarus]
MSDTATATAAADSTVDAVVSTVARSATEIRRGLVGRRGDVDEENPSGETQAEADLWADDLLAERLTAIDGVAEYASEERPEVVDAGNGRFGVAVDPLDGSSNLKSNNTMGTIFGVYDAPLPASGRDLVAGGYVLYGPITTMAVADDDGVRKYELTDEGASLVEADVTLPDDPLVYGFGGRVPDWPEDFRRYAREVESDPEMKLRYGGAMIADVNQVLTYGGTFAYPGLESAPNGKLRLQFEGNPIGYVIEQAGGRSSNGERSLLDVEPTELHQRTPLHVGNESLIDLLEGTLG